MGTGTLPAKVHARGVRRLSSLVASLAVMMLLGAAFAAGPALASSVTGVTAPTLSSTATGIQHVKYSVGFTATTGAIGAGTQTIKIDAPAGTVLPTSATIHNVATNATFSVSGALTNAGATNTLNVSAANFPHAGDVITVSFSDVKNPTSTSNNMLSVSTSSDTTPVASPAYSLTAPVAVTGVTGPVLSSSGGGIQHVKYTLGFTASAATGGLVAPGTITLDAPTGTVLPSGATISDTTTGQTFSVGGTRTNANRTIALNLSGNEVINAGDHVTITFNDVTNPPTGSGYQISLSTSSDTTPVLTGSYALTAPTSITGVTGVTLSSSATGIQHVRYMVGFTASTTTGGLVAPGTITVDSPAGTVLPSGATIHNITTGATFSVGGTRTNSNRTIALNISGNEAINAGDQVTITFDDVTNPTSTSGNTLSISTSSDTTPVSTAAYSLTAPTSITGITPVTLSTSGRGLEHVTYSIGFTASSNTGGLVAPGTITVDSPSGTVLPSGATIHNVTTGVTFSVGGTRTNSNRTIALNIAGNEVINAGDQVTITFTDVTNTTTASGNQFIVSTSSDTVPVTSPSYTTDPPTSVQNVSGVTLSSAAGGIQHVKYSFSFDASSSTGRLVAPGTITVTAPAGTVLPASATITDSTTGNTFSVGGTRSNNDTQIVLNIAGNEHIEPADHVTITFTDVTSPPTGSGFGISLSTSSDPTTVQTPTYGLTAPQTITNVAPLTASSTSGGATGVTYTLGFTASSTGRLVAPGTITVVAPSGTTLPSVATIHDITTGSTFSIGGTRSNANATAVYNLAGNQVINPGDGVTVTLSNVTNPPGGAQPVDLSTSSDPAAVKTPTDTQPQPPSQPLPPPPTPPEQQPQEQQAAVPVTLALSGTATDLVGGTHSVQATAQSGTTPLAGGKVVWSVGGANPSSGIATTGGDGKATISWNGAKSGTDTVTAFVDTNGNGSRDADEPQQTFVVQWLAPPTVGKTANVEPISGVVLIKRGNTFVPLDGAQQVPLGSTLDTTKGRVELQTASATGSTAKPQSGEFYKGIFAVTQTKDRAPVTELTLNGALTCVQGKARVTAAGKSRSLWGRDHGGRFRTRGRFSTATVRGTEWLTKDSCTSTITTVRSGSVVVRDLAKRKNITVKRGRSYVARAKRSR